MQNELRPLHPPLPFSEGPADWLLPAIVVLVGSVLLSLAYAASRLRLKIRIRATGARGTLDPDATLAMLNRRRPVTNADVQTFYATLASVVRVVVHTALGVRAPYLSTGELVDRLARQSPPTPVLEDLERLLRTADRAKFSGWPTVHAATCAADLERARRVVRILQA